MRSRADTLNGDGPAASNSPGAMMRRTDLTCCVCVLGAACAGALAADPNPSPAKPVKMTASDIGADLTHTLLKKPKVPITPMKEAAEAPERPRVPLEGSMVVDRLCRVAYDAKSEWFVLTIEAEPNRRDELPRRALPCALLEQVERVVAQSPGCRFRVSGETTVYEGHGYLLLTKATVLSGAPVAAAPTPAPAVRPAAGKTGPQKPPPAQADGAKGAGAEPSSDDILNRLLGEKVGRPVQVGTTRPEVAAAPSVAPGAGKPLAGGRGAMVVDRLVRVISEEVPPWWQARFEADNTLREPPMRLLPCGFLTRARQMRARRGLGPDPVLRVSGLVTRYKGQRYLLLRKALLERRLGRF